jgi:hypothetical protein
MEETETAAVTVKMAKMVGATETAAAVMTTAAVMVKMAAVMVKMAAATAKMAKMAEVTETAAAVMTMAAEVAADITDGKGRGRWIGGNTGL